MYFFFYCSKSHKKRQKNDMQFQFAYTHWLVEANQTDFKLTQPDLYKAIKIKHVPVFYFPYRTSPSQNKMYLDSFKKKKQTAKFLCVNDVMNHEDPENEKAIKKLIQFYEELYPQKSSFEL